MSEEWLGCGVATHDSDCLCDVIIKNPLPPLEECFSDAVQEMWMGARICELKNYGIPWDDKQILDYLLDLENFYDAFHELDPNDFQALCLEDMEAFDETIDEEPAFIRWSRIRDAVQYCMDRFDNSLLDITIGLNLKPIQVIDALTTGKAGNDWTDARLQKLDEKFMESNLNFADISREMELPTGVVRGLKKYWVQRRSRFQTSDNPAKDRMHWLCRNTNFTPREIVDIVHKEHNVLYARSSVSKTRQRIVHNDYKR